jgi:hypothetical protein
MVFLKVSNSFYQLESLCAKGDAQTELVMLVMLRIVEDVAVLQTLEQNQRRKEIYQVFDFCRISEFKKFTTKLIYGFRVLLQKWQQYFAFYLLYLKDIIRYLNCQA